MKQGEEEADDENEEESEDEREKSDPEDRLEIESVLLFVRLKILNICEKGPIYGCPICKVYQDICTPRTIYCY